MTKNCAVNERRTIVVEEYDSVEIAHDQLPIASRFGASHFGRHMLSLWEVVVPKVPIKKCTIHADDCSTIARRLDKLIAQNDV